MAVANGGGQPTTSDRWPNGKREREGESGLLGIIEQRNVADDFVRSSPIQTNREELNEIGYFE